MVNSTWTKRHVDRLLRPFHWDNDDDDDVDVDPASKLILNSSEPLDGTLRNRLSTPSTPNANSTELHPPRVRYSKIVYPPCDTIAFSSLPLTRTGNIILSVAQFRYACHLSLSIAFDFN
jgi:alpha-1,2-mannosyltransferase